MVELARVNKDDPYGIQRYAGGRGMAPRVSDRMSRASVLPPQWVAPAAAKLTELGAATQAHQVSAGLREAPPVEAAPVAPSLELDKPIPRTSPGSTLGLQGPIPRTSPDVQVTPTKPFPYDVQFDPSVSPESRAAFMRDPARPATIAERGLTPTGFTRTTPDISSPFPEDTSIGGLVQRAADTKDAAAREKMALDRAEFGLKGYGGAEDRRIREERFRTLGVGDLARGEAAQMTVAQAKKAQAMQDAIYAEKDPTKRAALLTEFNARYGDPAKAEGKFIEDPLGQKDPFYLEKEAGGTGLTRYDVPTDYVGAVADLKLSSRQRKKAEAWGKKNPKATDKEAYAFMKSL